MVDVALEPARFTYEGHTQVGSRFPVTCGIAHVVQFYESERVLIAAVVEQFGSGLAAGDPVVMIATEAHRQGVANGLRARGFDLDRLIESGHVTMIDAATVLEQILVDQVPDRDRFTALIGPVLERAAAAAGSSRVRAYGEMVDLLWRAGERTAAVQLEDLWNGLARSHSFSLTCSYLMGEFLQHTDSAALHDICRAHTHVVPPESQRGLPERIGLADRSLEHEVEHRKAVEYALRESLRDQRRAEETLRRNQDELRRLLAAEQEARCAAEAAQRAARDADRRKDEFLAMLGHELRNPLAPIFTALQVMELRGVGGEREQQLIARQVRHMARLVDDLLDVSRITGGKLELDRRRVELAAVMTRALEMASPLLEERGHLLTVEVARDGLVLDVDAFRLAQVFGNLLTNAAKYTDPGGRIAVRAQRIDDQIVVTVSDTGIGIAPEMLSRIFDLFVQSDRSLDRSQGGLGIGLSLARGLVEAHGGTIGARSGGVGKGCELTVWLPAAALAAPSATPVAAPIRAMTSTGCRRVLVVDDNADAADSLADLLTELGHRVAVAYEGTEALSVATTFSPDVALLDIGLPGMDGFELATRLRSARSPLQLVAITGYGQDADKHRSEVAGFDAHLVKPIEIRALLSLLAQPSALAVS